MTGLEEWSGHRSILLGRKASALTGQSLLCPSMRLPGDLQETLVVGKGIMLGAPSPWAFSKLGRGQIQASVITLLCAQVPILRFSDLGP